MTAYEKMPAISKMIWDTKYRYRKGDEIIDKTVEDTWRRVAKAVASNESDPEFWYVRFYDLLSDFKFLPGGRILANAGTARNATTMYNCYIMNVIPDSMEGIFDVIKESALTQKQGGGVGFDFSTIRPKGEIIKGVESAASGPVSFMQVVDATCRTIMSAGARRGAILGALRCDHPDVEEFITCKRQEGNLRMFNLSVLVTDEFITAVRNNAPWNLTFNGKVYKTLPAVELWNKITQSTYDFAEPGVLFIDTLNKKNNLHKTEKIISTNPCFTGNMLLHTVDGPRSFKDLYDSDACPLTVVVDSRTVSTAPENPDTVLRDCTPVRKTGTDVEVFKVTVADGKSVTATAYHKFYSSRGKVELQYLVVGDSLWTAGGGESVIVSIEPAGREDVYCVTQPDGNSIVVNGLAVGNCGEIPGCAYASCLLGSLNLTQYVRNAFLADETKDSYLDLSALSRDVRVATRFLDNIIDLSKFPLPQQEEEAKSKRRMGLGFTGLANALAMLRVPYGSTKSVTIVEGIMRTIQHAAYEASVSLAKEKGSFPLFNAQEFKDSDMFGKLDADLQRNIVTWGLRNSHLTAIAPTGTISLLAGNVSSGIEPTFSLSYDRKIRVGTDQETETHEVKDYAWDLYQKLNPNVTVETKPDFFVTSDEVKIEDGLRLHATAQYWVDNAISRTVNVPTDFPFEDFKDIYLKAYDLGLKGCTTFRPSEYITGVLTKKADKPVASTPTVPAAVDSQPLANQALANPSTDNPPMPNTALIRHIIPDRPAALTGTTYKVKTPATKDAFYVTINDIIDNGKRRPYEIFINTKNLQHWSWVVALTRTISAIFRREPDPSFLVEELSCVYDPAGGYFSDGEFVPSLPAEIGRVIAKHLKSLDSGKVDNEVVVEVKAEPEYKSTAGFCPQCNQAKLIASEGCLKCLGCGYSKCG